ncbi:hypothetical protein QWY93_10725 [Echinicola jeungdonensis]|uniref:Beta-lactamase-inhibitor-like PepSY-like domain-containing protein n=1 Tax=Echinicola jeungdonensis TaxID=709343 RepID=A0ABV5J6F1_9BACT|nr:hypothetical protein [Echinicola jeungdonensis]MDN3669797.1 hypothetical protein [Echinicola jeungdonensis]
MTKPFYLLSFSLFLFLVSCGDQSGETTENQHQESSFGPSEVATAPEKAVALDDLPQKIAAKINKNELLSTFTLKEITKVQGKNQAVYDLTFIDPDNQTVIASFDKSGNIIQQ